MAPTSIKNGNLRKLSPFLPRKMPWTILGYFATLLPQSSAWASLPLAHSFLFGGISEKVKTMIERTRKILSAVVVLSILLINVQPTVCQAASLFSPITYIGNSVMKTTKKVANTSVSTVKTVVAAPKNLLTKVGKTITGKK